ncbi:MerR family DNA-binding transcriptional regulator [Streptomyces sp. NPDC054863]
MLARATGTTARALRHHEQAGLLTSHRPDNGYRIYDPDRSPVRVRTCRSGLGGFGQPPSPVNAVVMHTPAHLRTRVIRYITAFCH